MNEVGIERGFLSLKEAAAFLGVSTVTLWRARAAKKLNYYRIGNLVKFSLADLQAFAEAGRNVAALNQPRRKAPS